MKRKKSRHKIIAVDFLSNISLDGPCQARVLVSGRIDSHLTALYGGSITEANLVDRIPATDANLVSYGGLVPPAASFEKDASEKFLEASQAKRFSNGKTVGSHIDWATAHGHHKRSSKPDALATSALHDKVQHGPLEFFEGKQSSVTAAPQAGTVVQYKPTGGHRELDSRALWSDLQSKRLAICPKGFPKTILTVFSILCHKRSPGRGQRPLTVPCRNSVDSDTNPTVSISTSSQSKHSSLGTITRDHGPNLFGSDHVRPLSSFRPVGDEVLSFSAFLHPRLNYWASTVSGVAATGCRSFSSAVKEVDTFLSSNSESQAPSTGIMYDHPLSTTWSTTAPLTASGLRQTPTAGNYLPSRRAHMNNPWSRPNRPRNPSGTSMGSASGVNAIVYPDPLMWYSPLLLDDPDLLVATGKQVFQLPNYLTSVLTYTRPTEQKRNVNREFHERFPLVQLTLTKLRSIKAVLVHVIYKLSFDLWIAAHAHVLFEKLILKLFVNKLNRRLCASAALLISAKLNDVKGCDLTNLLVELENNFRISRRDLLHAELDVALGLEFCLLPSESEIWAHCCRIYKNLDLTPPYPMRCFPHTVTPLQSRVTESV